MNDQPDQRGASAPTTIKPEEGTVTTPTIEIYDMEWAYFAEGHIDAETFLAACEAQEILWGVITAETAAEDGIRAHWKPEDVQHLWYVEDPERKGDDDAMRVCEPGTSGAEAWTRVPTP